MLIKKYDMNNYFENFFTRFFAYANRTRTNVVNEVTGNLIVATSTEILDFKFSRKRFDSMDILYKSKVLVLLEFEPDSQNFYLRISKEYSGVEESKYTDKVMMSIQKYLVTHNWTIIPGRINSPEVLFVYNGSDYDDGESEDSRQNSNSSRSSRISREVEDITDSLDDYYEEEEN